MENFTQVLVNVTQVLDFETVTKFSWHDYLFFVILLILSTLIGIYFGFFQKQNASAEDYLLGGKDMGVFEISLSLISSTISGLTILAVPSDIYKFGVSYWFSCVASLGAFLISYFFVMPIFYKLKTPSTYEYLSERFDLRIRQFTSFIFTFSYFLYLPIVIYVPALALAQGTGFNIHYITPFICGVCIFYTTIGGLKAVVWTDALQFLVMIGATLVVTYIGTNAAGGLSEVWNISRESNRTVIDFDLDMTKRDTFWTNNIGLFMLWNYMITFGQGCVQKCLALPSNKEVKKAYIWYAIGIVGFFSFSVYTGLLIYARYSRCDPFTSRKIERHDQILPYYILDIASDIPGLPGIFIAGVFSASLSTLSASMNALSCTLFEDFVSPFLTKTLKPKQVSYILQLIVALVGIICTLLVWVVQNFHSVLEIGLTVGSLSAGPLIGVFILGMFVPCANTKGALSGMLSSLCIMSWIVFTSLYYKLHGYINFPTKPLSVAECQISTNVSFITPAPPPEWTPNFIYRISFYYYSVMGCFLVVFIGYVVSKLTKPDKPLNRDLISPVMHWALESQKEVELLEYHSVEKANHIMEKI